MREGSVDVSVRHVIPCHFVLSSLSGERRLQTVSHVPTLLQARLLFAINIRGGGGHSVRGGISRL